MKKKKVSRDQVLYVRIKPENKMFVVRRAKALTKADGPVISESVVVDELLDKVRNASKEKSDT